MLEKNKFKYLLYDTFKIDKKKNLQKISSKKENNDENISHIKSDTYHINCDYVIIPEIHFKGYKVMNIDGFIVTYDPEEENLKKILEIKAPKDTKALIRLIFTKIEYKDDIQSYIISFNKYIFEGFISSTQYDIGFYSSD